MIKTKQPFLLLTVTLLATLATLMAPAQAVIIDDMPLVTFVRDPEDPHLLISLEISNLEVRKGIVEATRSGRLVLETSGRFFDHCGEAGSICDPICPEGGTSVDIALLEPEDSPIFADKEQEQQRSTSKLLPVLRDIPPEDAANIKAILDQDASVKWEVKVSLVLVDEAGARHVLDSVTAICKIAP